jgi:tetratricopeptide (TPR) repeat protein
MSLIESHFSSDRSFSVLSISLILILTGIVYANSLRNDFTNWDDPGLVVENRAIRSLDFQNILQIFTPSAGHTYQPVRVLSYAIDYHFWELNPMGYHIGNTLLHAVSAIFLYLVLVKVLNAICPNRSEASNRLVALVSVLLFVVHPVNVESVAWIASRKYGLLAFFSFLSLYFFIQGPEKKRQYILCYSFSIAAYALALLSSPVSVTLIGLFFLYDYCRSRGTKMIKTLRNRFLYYVPYGLMSAIHSAVLWNVLSSGPKPVVKAHYMDNPVYTLLMMLQVLFDYIKNLIFPFWLNNRYAARVPLTVFEPKITISIGVLFVLVAFLLIKVRQGEKLSLFCAGWFFIALAPVLNVIPMSTKMADRYLYLPAVGMFLWFSSGLYDLLVEKEHRIRRLSVFLGLMTTIVFTFSILTFQRNKVWRNSETLWTDSLKKEPLSYIAHNNLGRALDRQGRLNEAIAHYSEVLRIKPDYPIAQNNMAIALAAQGKLDEAVACYSEAPKFKSDYPRAYNNLGIALAAQGKLDEAVACYSEALRIKPNDAMAHNNLGIALARQGKPVEAIAHFREALRINPGYTLARKNMEIVLAGRRNSQ